MILLIDNYDSFVHNLARYFERLGQRTIVVRNDAIDVPAVQAMRPNAIVLSPGPCTPREAGASLEIVRQLHREVPILGVCLGHQVIAEALGAMVVAARTPVHGRASVVEHNSRGLFEGVPSPLRAGRYHSLVVEPESLPTGLQPTAWTADGVLMALAHGRWPLYGVQFHPESILTQYGYDLLANFLRIAGEEVSINPGDLAHDELQPAIKAPQPLPAGPVTF
jgi:anthranilate synthase/aminodeoxychorismate synthase-like glutamine amidotransferase